MNKLLLLRVNDADYAIPLLDAQSIRKIESNDLCDGCIREYIKDNFGNFASITDLRVCLSGKKQNTDPYVVFISSEKSSAIVVDSVDGIISNNEDITLEASELVFRSHSVSNVIRVGDKVIPVLDLNQLLFRESCKTA